jgi:hypothetical protein
VLEAALAAGLAVVVIDHAEGHPVPAGVLEIGGVDLTDPAQAEGAVASVISRYGRLDVLANIAGGFVWQTTDDAQPAWDRMQALNLTTALNASRAALPYLKAATDARIVNVGSAAALLFDAADSDPAVATNPNANKALTVKACLMAGTTHRAAWTNNTPTSGASRGIATTPLDTTYGADLLNVDRAHRIFTGGEASDFQTPQTTAFTRHQGWDYVTSIASNTSVYWTFRVHKPVAEASVLATWHRQVATNFTTWNVQDLDLRLWKLEGGALVSITGDAGAASFASGNCESKSTVDNTEHLYLKNLSAGDYVLELRRVAGTQTALPVAVAWYMPDTQMTADLDGNGVVGPGDLAILLNSWGGSGLPDLSGDGVVNAADISIMLSQWGPVL